MPENQKSQPKVINKSGTLRMDDKVAERKQTRDMAGRPMDHRNDRRRDRNRNVDNTPKEFEEVTINLDRVSRTVAKGNDVTSAVQKATSKAKKNMITFAMDGETICHEVETRVTGADVLMKPAAPGTGIIAGGVVRSIIGLTGVKNLISKSLGSTNKVNIAYAVVEGLRQQVPRKDWTTKQGKKAPAKKESK